MTLFNQSGEAVKVLALNQIMTSGLQGIAIQNPIFSPQGGQQAIVLVNGQSFAWNGTNANGQSVQSGTYFVVATAKNTNGQVTSYTKTVTVLALADQYSLEVYSSSGEMVRALALGTYGSSQPTSLSVSKANLVFGTDPNQGFQFSFGASGMPSVTWNGMNSAGSLVSPGVYTVQLVSETPEGSSKVASVAVTVLVGPSSVLAGAVVVPNPVQEGATRLEVLVPNSVPGTSIQGRLYDLSGGLDLTATLSDGQNALIFSLGGRALSGGVYLVALQAETLSGQSESKILKVAILR